MRYLIAAAVLGLVSSSFAETINVPADYATIQDAVDAAVDGDEVVVAPGTYTGTGFEVVNTLGKPITIKASGTPEETIIDGEGQRGVVGCSSGEGADTIIDGFTITGGSTSVGGGIYCISSATITDCMITNNTASDNGGGILFFNDGSFEGNPTLTNCTISGNTAEGGGKGGGILCSYSNPTISGCTITDNSAEDDGGGIYCSYSNPTISDCTISGNTANGEQDIHTTGGGGIFCYSSNPTISGCTITNNTATYDGGGILCYASSSATITDCTITNNTATYDGGGILCYGAGSDTLLNSTVCGNSPNQIVGSYSDEGGNTVTAICPVPGACCTNGECVITEQEDCLAFYGTWLGEGTTCDDSPCPTTCLGDVNADGEVSVNDILTLIANWGPCP